MDRSRRKRDKQKSRAYYNTTTHAVGNYTFEAAKGTTMAERRRKRDRQNSRAYTKTRRSGSYKSETDREGKRSERMRKRMKRKMCKVAFFYNGKFSFIHILELQYATPHMLVQKCVYPINVEWKLFFWSKWGFYEFGAGISTANDVLYILYLRYCTAQFKRKKIRSHYIMSQVWCLTEENTLKLRLTRDNFSNPDTWAKQKNNIQGARSTINFTDVIYLLLLI